MTINYNHRSFFASVFNDWGYVLDFSNAEFDSFTFNSVGVAIQSEYGLSKGKSLTKFLEEAEYELVLKLIHDLIEYAKLKELPIIEEKKFKNAKKLLEQYKESVGFSMMVGAEVKDSFNDDYIEKQMKIMLEMVMAVEKDLKKYILYMPA